MIGNLNKYGKKEHFEVLPEDISSKFDLVLEGHQALHSEIRELGRKTDERFDLVDFKIDTLNKKIDGVAADLKATDERLSKKIDGVAADLKATDERLSKKIDGVAADLKATDERLNQKIDSVEARLSKKIDGVGADLKAHRTDTEAGRFLMVVMSNATQKCKYFFNDCVVSEIVN